MEMIKNRYSFVGLSTDTKPTTAGVGSTFYEVDTRNSYVCFDGTQWALSETAADSSNVIKSIDLNQAAGAKTAFTATTQNCFIDYVGLYIPVDLTGLLAELTIGAGDSAVLYTADTAGVGGASIRVAHVNDGINQSLSVTVSTSDITVHLATDGAAAVTSTANDVINAVNIHAAASLLVDASAPGAGTGLAAEAALANLVIFTGISVESTDVAPVEFISTTTGALANLTEGALLSYSGSDFVASTKTITLTIAGAATGLTCAATLFVAYRPVVAGGYLAIA